MRPMSEMKKRHPFEVSLDLDAWKINAKKGIKCYLTS